MMVRQDLFSQVIFDTFVVATGTDYPDALSGACLAQENFAPIVLINAANEQQVADFVEEFHGDRPFNTVYI